MPALNALQSQIGSLASLSGVMQPPSIVQQQQQQNRGLADPWGQRNTRMDAGTIPSIEYRGPASPFTSTIGEGIEREGYRFDQNTWGSTTGAASSRLLDDGGQLSSSLDRLNSSMLGGTQQDPFGQQQQPGMIGGVASLGGDWAGVDQWNNEIAAAAAATGVDPNLIKAVMKLESNGDPAATGAPGVVGLMQVYTNVWGNGPWEYDNAANIMKGAEILKYYLDTNNGDPYEAMRGYHGYGYDGYTTDQQYADIVMRNYQMLQQAPTSQIPTVGYNQYASMNPNNPVGNNIVSEALKYQGVPYVWGGIPGKGANPWDTGWDCSGFTYWLDQNYGSGALPMGSHYQYDYALRTGGLFTNTGQLQPGDLLFWDTGNMAGGGAELNRAGHVGIYIGNGQMLHAANPSAGTIVSSLNDYMNMYGFLGAMHSSYSGGSGGYTGMQQQRGVQPNAASNGWGFMRSKFGW